MIFLTATGCWVSWSFAELPSSQSTACGEKRLIDLTRPSRKHPCPRAADLCTWLSVRLRSALIGIAALPAGDFEGGAKDLGTYELRHGSELEPEGLHRCVVRTRRGYRLEAGQNSNLSRTHGCCGSCVYCSLPMPQKLLEAGSLEEKTSNLVEGSQDAGGRCES
jgi:hypothetical protein